MTKKTSTKPTGKLVDLLRAAVGLPATDAGAGCCGTPAAASACCGDGAERAACASPAPSEEKRDAARCGCG
jgi:hypothetical protein